ncbi:hypothetical protein Q4503_16195 [Colwellia sp. 6_MG-2023]|uniref:alpha/beta hydrolase n=1 Tax=Colwellia sp. 6_MG-2023 TaxID=3062676 RepID=UPI0026E2D1F6|nr:hypothetical protein [Colwellia sp. 6_MG-2023]MDO6489236.1 hypothetical protein [Colwellia sp. 6_MG-2023]
MAIFINWATFPPVLPKPTGPYTVAVSEWQIKTNRDEVYTLQANDKRQLHIKIWYPTDNWQTLDKGNYKPKPQLANYTSTNMAEVHAKRISQFGPIGFLKQPLTKSLEEAKLHAYAGTSVSKHKEKYPVLLFSHGHRAHIDYSNTTLQDLASHGYIVIGVNHSYEMPHSVLPDGTELIRTDVTLSSAQSSSLEDTLQFEKILTHNYQVIHQIVDNGSFDTEQEKFAEAFQNIIDTPQGFSRDLPIRVDDLFSVIEFLQMPEQKESSLVQAMNFDKLAALGMSFGGPTATEFCRLYQHCMAMANIDGTTWGTKWQQVQDVPMLWIASTKSEINRLDRPYLMQRWHAPHSQVLIPGVRHQGFTDIAFLSPFLDLNVLEFPHNIKPRGYAQKVHHVTNLALVKWFDLHLKSKISDLQYLENVLPGVRVSF